MSDEHETPERDRGECLVCHGTGSLAVILGDDEQQERCWSCLGNGVQLTRDELASDLRLVVDDEDMPSFANHGEEVAWHLANRRTA